MMADGTMRSPVEVSVGSRTMTRASKVLRKGLLLSMKWLACDRPRELVLNPRD